MKAKVINLEEERAKRRPERQPEPPKFWNGIEALADKPELDIPKEEAEIVP